MPNFTKIATLEGRTVGLIRKAKNQSRVCDLENSDNQWVVKTSELVDIRLRGEDSAPAPTPQTDSDPFEGGPFMVCEKCGLPRRCTPDLTLRESCVCEEAAPAPPQPEAPTQDAPAPMRVELKSVKIAKHLSEETVAFSASVWIDGKRAGTAKNGGRGGNTHVLLDDHAVSLRLDAYCASLPVKTYDDMPGSEFPVNAESLIDDLVEEHSQKQWTKQQCRKKTLFQMPGDNVDSYRTILRPFSPMVKAHLIQKYGDQVTILNETL